MKTIILYGNYLGFFYCCYYKIQKKKKTRQEKKENLISLAGHVKEVSALEPEGIASTLGSTNASLVVLAGFVCQLDTSRSH